MPGVPRFAHVRALAAGCLSSRAVAPLHILPGCGTASAVHLALHADCVHARVHIRSVYIRAHSARRPHRSHRLRRSRTVCPSLAMLHSSVHISYTACTLRSCRSLPLKLLSCLCGRACSRRPAALIAKHICLRSWWSCFATSDGTARSTLAGSSPRLINRQVSNTLP
jgi:hypothetical protein